MKLPVNYDALEPGQKRRVREEYVRVQKGLCCHCGEPLDGPPEQEVAGAFIRRELFPEGFFQYPVHLHHDRKTGLTIGAVHNRCNAVLWQYHGE